MKRIEKSCKKSCKIVWERCIFVHQFTKKRKTMTAQQLAKAWENGDIVSCKQSLAAAKRHLKKDLDVETHNMIVGIIEYTYFHERENTSVKKWKLTE